MTLSFHLLPKEETSSALKSGVSPLPAPERQTLWRSWLLWTVYGGSERFHLCPPTRRQLPNLYSGRVTQLHPLWWPPLTQPQVSCERGPWWQTAQLSCFQWLWPQNPSFYVSEPLLGRLSEVESLLFTVGLSLPFASSSPRVQSHPPGSHRCLLLPGLRAADLGSVPVLPALPTSVPGIHTRPPRHPQPPALQGWGHPQE